MSPDALVSPQSTHKPVLCGRKISKIYQSGDVEVKALGGVFSQ